MITSTKTTLTSRHAKCPNKAALLTEGDTHQDGFLAKPWRLCTTQQVEGLKILTRMVLLWSTSMFLSVCQPESKPRSQWNVFWALTSQFQLLHILSPWSSARASSLLSQIVFSILCHNLLSWSPTLLPRIGTGHMINVASIAVMAAVEARRLHVAGDHGHTGQPNSTMPMSALWLVVPLEMAGAGEACALPALVSLYYEEFPVSRKGTSVAMLGVVIAIGFYVSATVIDVVKKSTCWLPKVINQGRIDKVFWMPTVVGSFKFFCFVVCAKLYKRQPFKH
ncbi:hypothetical protein EJ110_NYTH13496 [Nymphaea thermarum]|nr:hypothetical protein EJ110_NYTH13496 [Nymphaea thermarum]